VYLLDGGYKDFYTQHEVSLFVIRFRKTKSWSRNTDD